MDSEHALQLVSDYVLGLLSAEENRRVEQHAHQCPDCREALRRERQVGALLRQTVQTAARPAAGRLEQLRPAPRHAARVRRQLYRQLAPLTALAVLLVVVLLAQTGGFGLPTPAFAQTAAAATATTTHTATASTPTATLASLDDASATLTRAARPNAPALALAAPRPAVAPPVAAVPPVAAAPPAAAATPVITYAR